MPTNRAFKSDAEYLYRVLVLHDGRVISCDGPYQLSTAKSHHTKIRNRGGTAVIQRARVVWEDIGNAD